MSLHKICLMIFINNLPICLTLHHYTQLPSRLRITLALPLPLSVCGPRVVIFSKLLSAAYDVLSMCECYSLWIHTQIQI